MDVHVRRGLVTAPMRPRVSPNQGSLFAGLALPYAPTDPPTSRSAAVALDRRGLLSQQRRTTLVALSRATQDGSAVTSAELAEGDLARRYLYARRLPELARLGYVRALPAAKRLCRATGQQAVPWIVTQLGLEVLS